MGQKHYIICSAIKYKDMIIAGRRHGDAFQTLENLLSPVSYKAIERKDLISGFIDNYGDFHTRAEAWVVAEKAEQILFGKGTQDPTETPLLISEHLFDDKDEL